MMKLVKTTAVAIFGILALGFCFLILPWLLLFLGLYLSPAPQEPVNTYGEFPFRLVYEIDGERLTAEDTLICEYLGMGMDEGSGKHLKWDVRLASDGDMLISGFKYCLFSDTVEGRGTVSIFCDVGNPQYYLGYTDYAHYSPGRISISSPGYSGIIREDELLSEYKLAIIEREFAEPMTGNGISEGSDYRDVAEIAAKGVTSTAKQPSYPLGTTQIAFLWENNTDKTIECGQSFYLQTQADGKWLDVYREYAARLPKRENVYLEPHTRFTYVCEIGAYAPDIPAGKYRVVSPATVPIGERSYEAKVLCGEFVIEDIGAADYEN